MQNNNHSERIAYQIRKSPRAKHIRISINQNGVITLVVPEKKSQKKAEKFLHEKKDWIEKTRNKIFEQKNNVLKKNDPNLYSLSEMRVEKNSWLDYQEHKSAAQAFVENRLEVLNKNNFFSFKKVFIKNQKTRWGSCSSLRNLNFNYKIIFLPPELADYLIIHELCHLYQMNHSKKFWNLVGQFIPDYQILKKQLR